MVKLANGNTLLDSGYQDPAVYAASRKKENTRLMYAAALKAFAKHVGIPYAELHTYLKNPVLTDITSFAEDKSAATRKGYVSVVVSWLKYNHVEFDKQQMDQVRVTVKKDDQTADEPLTVEIIRQMCDVTTLQGKTLFITLLATGMRIEELLLTELKNVDLERGTIHVPANITKTRNSRDVVLSFEAAKYLKLWLDQHDDYLKSSYKRGDFVRRKQIVGEGKNKREIMREDLLFPFQYETARSLFGTAIKKVYNIRNPPDQYPKINRVKNWGDLYDEKTGRSVLHLHSFRGTFRMQLRKGVDQDICEILMGHTLPNGGAYRDITIDDLIKEYRKGEEHVTVYPTDTLKQQLLEATSAEARNRADIEALKAENEKLKFMVQDLKEVMMNPNVMHAVNPILAQNIQLIKEGWKIYQK